LPDTEGSVSFGSVNLFSLPTIHYEAFGLTSKSFVIVLVV